MSNEEDVDLPVAAEITAVGGMPDEGAAIQNFVQISEGDELVKKSDAEEAIKKARKEERQRILDKIDDRKTRVSQKIQTDCPYTPLKIRKATLADLRDQLEEEVDES